MTKATTVLGLMTTLVLLGATDAGAQTAPSVANVAFINVHVGAQPQAVSDVKVGGFQTGLGVRVHF